MRTAFSFQVRALSSALLVSAFLAQAQDTRQPFTMIMVSQGSQPSPVSIRRLFAVRSDGSSVTVALPAEGDLKNLPQFGDRAVILRPQRQSVYVLDNLKLKTTSPLEVGNRVPPPMHPACLPSDGGMSKFLREETVLGWPAYVYESSYTSTDGAKETNTRWLAPGLNCRDIQGRLEIIPPTGRTRTLWNRAASVTPGEPDPALFAVPDDYREVSREEMERERAKSLGRTALPPSLEEHLARSKN